MRTSIQIANYSQFEFVGWRRTTVDRDPGTAPFRLSNGILCMPAGQLTPSLYALDCLVVAAPGSVTESSWTDTVPAKVTPMRLPDDPVTFFGVPRVVTDHAPGGVSLDFVSAAPSGIGWKAHFRGRISSMLVADLYVLWLGGEIIDGEWSLTASDPVSPNLVATIPPGIAIRFGTATTVLPTGFSWADWPCDGTTLAVPVTFIYTGRISAHELPGALAVATYQIRVVGSDAWPQGAPIVPRAFDPLAWNRRHLPGAFAALSRWEPEPGVGPNKRSGDTGAQADQCFVGGETATRAGAGSELTRYLVALWEGRSRPCNYREVNGNPLDLSAHPGLLMWDGMPDPRITRDMLGKSRQTTDAERHFCGGPDVEHANLFNLAVAYRLTGSRVLQQFLQARAKVYLCQQTYASGISTSQPYAARAIGIEGINAYLFWHCLEDRALAIRVRDNWIQRWRLVVSPSFRPDHIWDVRTDDPRLGPGEWWLPWQQAYGVYGLDLAGAEFGEASARAAALAGARKVVSDAYMQVGGIWLTAPVRAVSAAFIPPNYSTARASVHEDTGVPRAEQLTDVVTAFDGSFNLFGMPMAPSVILRHDPNDSVARSIITQALSDFHRLADPAGYCWIPPEVSRG